METIKSASEFGRVFSRGRRLNDRLVRIRLLRTGGAGRVAFVAPKRLGNAVHRNRCKRMLREAARSAGLPREGVDVILLATADTHDASVADVGRSLERLLSRGGL